MPRGSQEEAELEALSGTTQACEAVRLGGREDPGR
jgi:hypothetical protein